MTRGASGALAVARMGTAAILRRAPAAMRATRAGVQGTTTALQALPDSTLRWLAAGSVGLGAGLYLSGAPRVVTAAGAIPAALMGAAMVLRPLATVASRDRARPRPSRTRA